MAELMPPGLRLPRCMAAGCSPVGSDGTGEKAFTRTMELSGGLLTVEDVDGDDGRLGSRR